jgi:hypothetical protein
MGMLKMGMLKMGMLKMGMHESEDDACPKVLVQPAGVTC